MNNMFQPVSPENEPQRTDAELLGAENTRGERPNTRLRLVAVGSEQRDRWGHFIGRGMPREVFEKFGLFGVAGSEDYENVVEHSGVVVAAAITAARQLQQNGTQVNVEVVRRGAWVHDVTKRLDVLSKIEREREANDGILPGVLKADFNYSDAEIDVAMNTGMLPDRFEQDPVRRRAAIEARSIEANIVGYVDARTRDTNLLTLDEACRLNAASKPKRQSFFTDFWLPYYKDVEQYLVERGFEPEALNNDAIFETVSHEAEGR